MIEILNWILWLIMLALVGGLTVALSITWLVAACGRVAWAKTYVFVSSLVAAVAWLSVFALVPERF